METKYKISPRLLISLLVLLVTTVSCNKNFLDEKVYSNISATNFWNSKEDALAGLYSSYTLSLSFGPRDCRPFFLLTDMVTDDMDQEYSNTESERTQLQTFVFSPRNKYFNDAWVALYKTIAQSNLVIDRVPGIDEMSKSDKNMIVGEAKFLRALEYFYLVQLWGEVPLDTTAVGSIAESQKLKSSVESIYEAIVKDLQFAEAHCADTPPEIGRATKWAAKALLAKVYLTMAGPFTGRDSEKLNLSAAKLAEIVDSKRFSLVPNIIDYFDLHKKGSTEMIYEHWTLGDVSDRIGSFMHRNFMPSSLSAPEITKMATSGYKAWTPTPDLYSKFKLQDDRFKMYMNYYIKKNSDGTFKVNQYNVPYIGKYSDSTTVARDYKANNLPVLRYADVLLMYSEVLNELGTTNPSDGKNQYDYINEVRGRAFSSNPDAHIYPNMAFSKSDFRDSLLLERRLEFAHEGHRLFDMKRTGIYISTMTSLAANNRALLADTPPVYTYVYPAGVYPNPKGPTPYKSGTIKFKEDFFKNTKMVGPEPYQIVYPIPDAQLSAFDIGQNTGYN